MKLISVDEQSRRDCWITIQCENCDEVETNVSAYDDRNYWDNVLPNRKCKKCGKSTNDINPKIRQKIHTHYAENEVV